MALAPFGFVLAALLVAAPPQGARLAGQGSGSPSRQVLVLYSYSRLLPWEGRVIAGLNEALAGIELHRRPFLYEESLDSARLGDPTDNASWASFLALKYRKIKLDAVITESQQAAALLLSQPSLFPGAERYILHFAPSSSLARGRGDERRFSSSTDLEKAIRTITTVLPSAKRVVVVTDRSSVGLARSEQVRGISPALADRIAIELWNDFTEAELLERAGKLPRDSALLYLPVQQDHEGRPLVPGLVAERLAKASSAPVFSHFDSLLGTGVVGGYLVSGIQLGRLMGDIAARGEAALPPSQDAYSKAIMGSYFDSRALARWGVPDARLPPGSVVLYREKGFLQLYWAYILTALGTIVIETLLILALFRVSAQRKRAMGLLAIERSSLEAKVTERTAALAAANKGLSAEVAVRKLAEERERAAASEKATLLKELRHRVKNNMSMIASLASLEENKAATPEAREALAKLGSRIASIATLYETLSDSGAGLVELRDYVNRVVDSAADSLGADARGIELLRSIENIKLDVKRAVPLGLVINELVTDSLKYAFPRGKRGKVTVRLAAEGEDLALEVSDDGVGLPPDFESRRSEGFGLNLVELLAGQLGAGFAIKKEGGAGFRLTLPRWRDTPPG
jgi:two-component system, cell cycle response regulator